MRNFAKMTSIVAEHLKQYTGKESIDYSYNSNANPEDTFQRACENCDIKTIYKLLVDYVPKNGLLHQVIRNGYHIDIVKLIIAAGADVNEVWSGYTPLIRTLSSPKKAGDDNQMAIVQELINSGAEVNAYISPFESNNTEAALHIPTALHAACIFTDSSTEAVKLLLENGADPNIEDQRHQTSIVFARGRPESVELLIKYGATAPKDKYFVQELVKSSYIKVVSALMESCASKLEELEKLEKQMAPTQDLAKLISNNHEVLLSILHDKDFNSNVLIQDAGASKTLLDKAIKLKDMKAAEILLSRADIEFSNPSLLLDAALEYAITTKDENIVKLLAAHKSFSVEPVSFLHNLVNQHLNKTTYEEKGLLLKKLAILNEKSLPSNKPIIDLNSQDPDFEKNYSLLDIVKIKIQSYANQLNELSSIEKIQALLDILMLQKVQEFIQPYILSKEAWDTIQEVKLAGKYEANLARDILEVE